MIDAPSSRFSLEVLQAMREVERLNDEVVPMYLAQYVERYITIPGAPSPEAAKPSDVPGIVRVDAFLAADADWETFLVRLMAQEAAAQSSFNPFLPLWDAKAEGKLTPWASSFDGGISPQLQAQIDTMLRTASPAGVTDDQVFVAPSSIDTATISELATAIADLSPRFFRPLGDAAQNPDWAWAPTLAVLAGLGLPALRMIATKLPDEGTLAHYATLDDGELTATVIKAHETSGYPAGLYRVPWHVFRRVMDSDELMLAKGYPRHIAWVRACMLLHFLKHTRITYAGDAPVLIAAYRGSYIRRELTVAALESGWTSSENIRAFRDICATVGISIASGPSASFLELTAMAVFRDVRPTMSLRVRPVHHRPDVIPGPGVVITDQPPAYGEAPWIDTGVAARNLAVLDLRTGKVDMDAVVSGTDALVYDWKLGRVTAEDLANWRGTLPRHVTAERPSAFINKYIKNRNVLGCAEGADAVLDALIVADLFRPYLAGSPVGLSLQNEFPPVFVMPTGHTELDTTNQGKSMACRLLGNALVPGLPITGFTPLDSAPAQRSLADTLYQYGTGIYDEFVMPTSMGHFMNKQGIQTLATGTRHGPGQASMNGPPPKLQHPMFFNTKIAAVPEDIHNRMVAVFLDTLTSETRSTGDELGAILSGKASIEMRLSCIMWVMGSGLLQDVHAAQICGGDVWRFNGHYTIAKLFAHDEQVKAYFVAARQQCLNQLSAADESGLASQLSIGRVFDPGFYLENMTDMTASAVYELAKGEAKGKPMRMLEFMTAVIEDGSRRRLLDELKRFGLSEKQAISQFARYLTNQRITMCHGHAVSYVPSTESIIPDTHKGKGSKVAYVHIVKAPAPPKA